MSGLNTPAAATVTQGRPPGRHRQPARRRDASARPRRRDRRPRRDWAAQPDSKCRLPRHTWRQNVHLK